MNPTPEQLLEALRDQRPDITLEDCQRIIDEAKRPAFVLQPHHVAEVLATLGPECRLSAADLKHQLEFFVGSFVKLSRDAEAEPRAGQMRAARKKALAALQALRQALKNPALRYHDRHLREALSRAEKAFTDDFVPQAQARIWGQRPAGRATSYLVGALWPVYRAATGKAPTITTDDAESTVGGRFAEFARVSLDVFGVSITDDQLRDGLRSARNRVKGLRSLKTENCPPFTAVEIASSRDANLKNEVAPCETKTPSRRGSRRRRPTR